MGEHTYTLAEIRNGTGWPDGVRFAVIDAPAELEAEPQEWNLPVADRIANVAAEREAEAEEADPYAVGSIWHTSWGYDQTNVEFYSVVRETAASVWVVPMGSTIRDGRQWPTTTTGLATPEMHRKSKHGAYLRLDNVRSAWPYTGGGCYSTAASGGAGH